MWPAGRVFETPVLNTFYKENNRISSRRLGVLSHQFSVSDIIHEFLVFAHQPIRENVSDTNLSTSPSQKKSKKNFNLFASVRTLLNAMGRSNFIIAAKTNIFL
jgi:hypothetical protein